MPGEGGREQRGLVCGIGEGGRGGLVGGVEKGRGGGLVGRIGEAAHAKLMMPRSQMSVCKVEEKLKGVGLCSPKSGWTHN